MATIHDIITKVKRGQIISVGYIQGDITLEDVQELAAVLPGSRIEELDLRSKNLRPEAIKELAAVLPQMNIKRLYLDLCAPDTDSLRALMQAITQTSLSLLSMGDCKLGSADGQVIADALANTTIEHLYLDNNAIGKSAEALARALPQSELHELNLEANGIDEAGADALIAHLPNSKLTTIYINDNDRIPELKRRKILDSVFEDNRQHEENQTGAFAPVAQPTATKPDTNVTGGILDAQRAAALRDRDGGI